LGTMLVYLGFEVVPEKEIARGQIWRTRRHPMSPRKETICPGNICLRIPSEGRDMWAVAPSCWKHTFSAPDSSKRSSNLGRRKFSSIAQYRSEVTVTVTWSISKKYGPDTHQTQKWHCGVAVGEVPKG
jgi:hypothetical protein